ncbi:hypothetical protein R3P38DRAFT_2480658, partial [Favolaschia claudopus]
INPVHLTLIICLILTNLPNLYRVLNWVVANISQPPNERLVPLYDREGELIGMVRIRQNLQDGSTRTRPRLLILVLDRQPAASSTSQIAPVAVQSTSANNSSHIPPQSWNGWPDGQVWTLFSQEELRHTGMTINWVGEAFPGHRDRGSKKAAVWQDGKQLHRRCMGALQCQSRACSRGLVCAPAARGIELHQQLTKPCLCGDKIELQPCGVTTYLFRNGVYFTHLGTHTHGKYTHSLNYRPRTPFQFEDFISKYRSSA